MASRLPLTRYRPVPGFPRDALAIRRQLAASPGLIGYALDADLARRTFWTFSVRPPARASGSSQGSGR
jgi:hypothetical protein